MAESLRQLHSLVASSTLLMLRSEGDDYGARLWCAAEVCVARPEWRHLVVRLDLIGQPIAPARSRSWEPRTRSTTFFVRSERPWRKGWGNGGPTPMPWRLLRHLHHLVFVGMHELETGRRTPLFVTPQAPFYFEGHKILLTEMIAVWDEATFADRSMDDGRISC